jgi:hypothetical protein
LLSTFLSTFWSSEPPHKAPTKLCLHHPPRLSLACISKCFQIPPTNQFQIPPTNYFQMLLNHMINSFFWYQISLLVSVLIIMTKYLSKASYIWSTPRFLSKSMKTTVHTKTCAQMFLTVSFFNCTNWTQHKSPLTDYRINIFWYIHTK